MAKRESYKIDPNDPDLKMFEEAIANFHPEFYALKQDGKPSYEHPDFCERTLKFSYLPGNKDPYDIHALNMMTREHTDQFINDKLHLLGVSLSQKVKTSVQEDNFKKQIVPVIENIKFDGVKGPITVSAAMDELTIYVLRGYVNTIIRYFKFKSHSDVAVKIIPDEISDIKKRCALVSNKIYNSSKSNFLNKHSGMELSRLSKYSVFSRVFIHAYNQRKPLYIGEAITLLRKIGVDVSDDDVNSIFLMHYIDVILVNELSSVFLKLEREEKPNKIKTGKRVRNPSEFSRTCYFPGKIVNSRNIYRKLFIKAWSYSYLRDKEISANKLAIHLSNYDEFFLCGESISNGIEDYQETRRNTLNEYFVEWRKQSGKGEGCLAMQLNEVSSQPYWLVPSKTTSE